MRNGTLTSVSAHERAQEISWVASLQERVRERGSQIAKGFAKGLPRGLEREKEARGNAEGEEGWDCAFQTETG